MDSCKGASDLGQKDDLTRLSVTFQRMVQEGKSPRAIKGQRTKYEKARRAYWATARRAAQAVNEDGLELQAAADRHDVDPSDVAQLI
jgi:hypothetical protein